MATGLKRIAFVSIACLAASPGLAAQGTAPSPASPVAALERCQKVASPAERLACFDSAAATLLGSVKRGDTSIVDRSDVRQVRRSLFGFAVPKLPFFRGDKSANDVADVLESRVAAVRSIGYGRYRITLADGDAVWETTETYSTMDDPRVGQKITLKRGALGRYTLSIDGQRGVTGRRVG
jgi:hypothetical protein